MRPSGEQISEDPAPSIWHEEWEYTSMPDVRASVHADGLVLLNIGNGLMFTANQIGAQIWENLAEQGRTGAVSLSVSRQYEIPLEQAERDVRGFLSDLEGHGLVRCDRVTKCLA